MNEEKINFTGAHNFEGRIKIKATRAFDLANMIRFRQSPPSRTFTISPSNFYNDSSNVRIFSFSHVDRVLAFCFKIIVPPPPSFFLLMQHSFTFFSLSNENLQSRESYEKFRAGARDFHKSTHGIALLIA